MNFSLVAVLLSLSTCCCLVINEEIQEHCVQLKQALESPVSAELSKNGFHREVITTVELRPGALQDVRVLLVYRWPSGVYVDPYQLVSHQSGWQILLDSPIDLEGPAYKSSGFATYVYPFHHGPTPGVFKVTIPVHGRYHEPSGVGKAFTSVHIEPPELLLRTEKCTQFNKLEPLTVVDAPCTVNNLSSCSWVKIRHQHEELGPLTFQLPVGDGSQVALICGGTLLLTLICCIALSKSMWEHRLV